MSLEIREFSVIVTANDYNPTILNPDFLQLNEIVDKEWNLGDVINSITTPPFATVQFSNGISIVVESNTLQVVDRNPSNGIEQSKVTEIVRRYVGCLQHVRYTAVGINFKTMIRVEDPVNYMKERFIKEKPWENIKFPFEEADLKMKFKVNDNRFTLTIENSLYADSSSGSNELVRVLTAGSNFHYNCSGYPCSNQVQDYLQNVSYCCNASNETLKEAFQHD